MLFSAPSLYMDYDGQRRAETYFELIITASSVIGFIAGYYLQMFSVTVGVLGLGFIIAALITIPPWPMYRRKPLKWQKHIPFGDDNSNDNASHESNTKPEKEKAHTNKKSGGKGGKKN